MPKKLGNSPKIRKLVIIKNKGVRLNKGIVNDSGESLIAFIYKIAAITSNIATINKTLQKLLPNLGIGIKNNNDNRNGVAYKNLVKTIT